MGVSFASCHISFFKETDDDMPENVGAFYFSK